MLKRTSHEWAPWHVVPGDSKHYARLAVVETVCDSIEAELTRRGWDLDAPTQSGPPEPGE
jgi:hypothetical protein